MPSLYSDAYIDHGNAYFRALSADDQWQRELDVQNVDRYSTEAHGTEGSALHSLYGRKLQADQDLRDATDALRLAGKPAEIQAVAELYGSAN